jgi:hypothetical protein
MKNVLITLIAILTALGADSCKKKDNTPSNTGSVLFVNGCAGTLPAIDAKADGVNIGGALNMAFPSSSGYKSIKSGAPVVLAYYLTNTGTPVASQTVNLTMGAHYSAFCAGIITNPSFLLTTDDMTAPAASSAKIRFVNLSNDDLNITATAQTTVIGSNVKSKQISDFIQVAAGSFELKAGDPSDISTVVATEPTLQGLGAGKIYTLMLTGSKTGTGVSALKLTLISNN